MKKRYRIWHLPVLSFYSKPFYRDVAARWKGTNLGYFCLLLAICLVPTVWNASRDTVRAIDRYQDIYLMQIPPMQLSNGRLSADAPQPYSIIEGNRTVLLIDTTGSIQTPEEADALALLTQTQLHIRQPRQPTVVYDLRNFSNLTLNQEVAGSVLARVKNFVAPVCYVTIYLGSLALLLLAVLLLAATARRIAALQKKSLNFKAGIRLAVVALTPALIIGALLALAGRGIAMPLYITPALYVMLVLAYLYSAAGSARQMRPNELYLDDERIGS
jgi:hypothetical protein